MGLEGNAALKALMNLIAPITQSNVAFQGLLVPKFVTTLKHQGGKGLSRLVKYVLGLWLLKTQGTLGAVLGLLASSLASALAAVYFYSIQGRRGHGHFRPAA